MLHTDPHTALSARPARVLLRAPASSAHLVLRMDLLWESSERHFLSQTPVAKATPQRIPKQTNKQILRGACDPRSSQGTEMTRRIWLRAPMWEKKGKWKSRNAKALDTKWCCLPSHPLSPTTPPTVSFPVSQRFPSGGQRIAVSASASVLPMNTQDWSALGDWLDLLAVQGTLKSLLQHHSYKASILWCPAFFMVQLSHPYMTSGEI